MLARGSQAEQNRETLYISTLTVVIKGVKAGSETFGSRSELLEPKGYFVYWKDNFFK